MGYGDEIIASFVVCELGKKYPDKKIAISAPHSFPNLRPWDLQQRSIYQNNPYLVDPEDVGGIDQERLIYYPDWKCRRDRLPYGKFPSTHKEDVYRYKKLLDYEPEVYRWLMDEHYTNKDGSKGFKVFPGSIFFSEKELSDIKALKLKYHDHFLINTFSSSANKDWGTKNWIDFVRSVKPDHKLIHANKSEVNDLDFHETKSFRELLMLMCSVKGVITTEGGVHHASAALNIPAFVLFGSRIDVRSMGYENHLNIIADGGKTPCMCPTGSKCNYCIKCWKKLKPSVVYEHFLKFINGQRGNRNLQI